MGLLGGRDYSQWAKNEIERGQKYAASVYRFRSCLNIVQGQTTTRVYKYIYQLHVLFNTYTVCAYIGNVRGIVVVGR